ncbi:MAG: guanylate kinase, partial [Bacillota bacterium]|nr:guanylate kinase [Bacillota bacterium]
TVISKFLTKNSQVYYSISATTRTRRSHEVNGVDYYFLDRTEFLKMIEEDQFLEHAEYVGNLYGTPQKPVLEALSEGRDAILEIEVTGALTVREKWPEAVLIFIVPPSFSVLEQRLKGRGTEPEEIIQKRLLKAQSEYKAANIFDYIVVNSDADKGADEIKAIIEAESYKTEKRKKYIEF